MESEDVNLLMHQFMCNETEAAGCGGVGPANTTYSTAKTEAVPDPPIFQTLLYRLFYFMVI